MILFLLEHEFHEFTRIMIIVKTTNGDQFINDATVNRVAHNKDTHTVTIHKGTVGTFQYAEHTIEHVEGVIYTNEAQATQWQDEGSLIKKLQGIIDQQKHELGFLNEMVKRLQSDLRHYSSNIIQVINYRKEGDMSDETAKRIRDDAETMKGKGNANIWEYRHPYDKEHEGEEYIEGKVIQTLREEVETLSHSLSELKDEMETMKRRHAIHVTDIYARTLWQRIVNKTIEP